MTVSDLIQGAEYSFSVAGVDAKGGIGKKNMSADSITLDSEWKMLQSLFGLYLSTYMYKVATFTYRTFLSFICMMNPN